MARETPPPPEPKPRRSRSAAGRDVAARPRTIGAAARLRLAPRGRSRTSCGPNLLGRLGEGEPSSPASSATTRRSCPAIENAILAGQDLVFLGERGQAKTRLARLLVGLLDPWLPIVAGGELNDDPFAPISPAARAIVAEGGDDDADRLAAARPRATARSWPRPTSPSPTSSARSTRSRSPRAATCPTS